MTLIIGVGNSGRGDDAAGLVVARRIRLAAAGHPSMGGPPIACDVLVTELDGDQLGLLDAWDDADDAVIVDAVCSGGEPGTVHHLDASRPLGEWFRHSGTHTFSLADVIELARALDRLPARISCYGIEGATFSHGAPMSPEVDAAVRLVTAEILTELKLGGGGS
jgi:hydrogenase maturation protease